MRFWRYKKFWAISVLDYKAVRSVCSDKINKTEQWNEYAEEYTSENSIRARGASSLQKNNKEYRPSKNPCKVLEHNFPLEEGKIFTLRIYVINNNTAYVSLGTSCDIGVSAVESIHR